ncbi:amidase signature domain-containing protein [Poronia punctata]|nr:amidase signature domain-containing protein [Poronia punctata]
MKLSLLYTTIILSITFTFTSSCQASSTSWEETARLKTQRTNSKIPSKWILDEEVVVRAREQQRITGRDIDGFLRTLGDGDLSLGVDVDVDRDGDVEMEMEMEMTAEKAVSITNMDVKDILKDLEKGVLRSTEVVLAFCVRGAVIHQVHPVFLDIAFVEAIQEAAAAQEAKEERGPLYGLPFTVKDVFHAKGMETSGSLVGWFNSTDINTNRGKRSVNGFYDFHAGDGFEMNRMEGDSEVVKRVRDAGGIVIGKTTVMQSTWAADTNNNILGELTNPWNKKLTPGGSTGGEGVLQALRGAAFGIGEDSGGSVSMPSSFNGIYSLKPSSGYSISTLSNGIRVLEPREGRLTMEGAVNFGTRIEAIEITAPGIMTASFSALKEVYKSTTAGETTEPLRSLNIAVLDDDGAITPHPPIQRVFKQAKDKLLENGATTTFKWQGTPSSNVSSIQGTLARNDDCIDVFHYREISGEPFVKELIDTGFQDLLPDGPGGWDADRQRQLDEAVELRDRYRMEYERIFDENNAHALIMPVTASTAWKVGDGVNGQSYTTYANVLNVPVITIPAGFVSRDVDVMPEDFQGFSDVDVEHMARYAPDEVDGMPVSVMILGRKDGEYDLLAVAEFIVEALAEEEEE